MSRPQKALASREVLCSPTRPEVEVRFRSESRRLAGARNLGKSGYACRGEGRLVPLSLLTRKPFLTAGDSLFGSDFNGSEIALALSNKQIPTMKQVALSWSEILDGDLLIIHVGTTLLDDAASCRLGINYAGRSN